ncbi:class I SAM-dependent methyltransferase [Pseudooceanicola nanhaiensis]|uniref:class I SAM-dependent methyltransferase n=1 Tax=Pseudooceanicola nanhaiensis TaxID=375761 RepID=UPI001CD7B8A1|nr:SAM-dependent methyltransferase [Pseudooceanicola nanhaiensis]MCA0919573.1 SAM-dependent methyltransferase [Pseudooceanicola nanhaiensis]
MTALKAHILARIATEGPMRLSDYMAECLLNPQHGYYTTRDPLGTAGDFTTAPEISQMFGELLGLALAQSWVDQGMPAPFCLAELGPGRGTLMADLLRATRAVPGFHDALRLHLVEASPALRDQQASRLKGTQATWVDRVEDLPDLPLFLIANEFFDALPIRQYRRAGAGWREVHVGAEGDRLVPGLAPAGPGPEGRDEDTGDGDLVETCPAGALIAGQIGARIAARGGSALIVDYGDWRSLGDTLQALRKHASTDPFEAPGEADLTAHVDFEPLARSAAPAAHTLLTTQGVFLERLGITARAQALAERLSGVQRVSHIAAHRRLTHPDEMGSLFKVMALYPQGAHPPPGLEPAGAQA